MVIHGGATRYMRAMRVVFDGEEGKERLPVGCPIMALVALQWRVNCMRQNTNLFKARGLFHRKWFCVGNSCIYSRIGSIKYEIELIALKIRSLSPTINISYGANLDFKIG